MVVNRQAQLPSLMEGEDLSALTVAEGWAIENARRANCAPRAK
jgi:hypothetical protein